MNGVERNKSFEDLHTSFWANEKSIFFWKDDSFAVKLWNSRKLLLALIMCCFINKSKIVKVHWGWELIVWMAYNRYQYFFLKIVNNWILCYTQSFFLSVEYHFKNDDITECSLLNQTEKSFISSKAAKFLFIFSTTVHNYVWECIDFASLKENVRINYLLNQTLLKITNNDPDIRKLHRVM